MENKKSFRPLLYFINIINIKQSTRLFHFILCKEISFFFSCRFYPQMFSNPKSTCQVKGESFVLWVQKFQGMVDKPIPRWLGVLSVLYLDFSCCKA